MYKLSVSNTFNTFLELFPFYKQKDGETAKSLRRTLS